MSFKHYAKKASQLENAFITLATELKIPYSNIVVPAGSKGRISNIAQKRIIFTSEPCKCCGVSVIISKCDYDIIGDIVLQEKSEKFIQNVNKLVELIQKHSVQDFARCQVDLSSYTLEEIREAQKLTGKEHANKPVYHSALILSAFKPVKSVTRSAFLKENDVKRSSELIGKKVKITEQLKNGYFVLPKDLVGELTKAVNGQIKVKFPKCDCCGVKPHISRLVYSDIEVVK